MRSVLMAIATLALTSCASTHMKQYMGKDIREVILDSGPPIGALDMADGARAFQFRWGGGAVAVPQTTTVAGSATNIGNTTWFQAQALTSPGGIFVSDGCVITYVATWNAEKGAWVVTDYRVPKQLVC